MNVKTPVKEKMSNDIEVSYKYRDISQIQMQECLIDIETKILCE